MRVLFSDLFTRNFRGAPEQVQKTFGKQLGNLLRDFRHPTLHTKKYDEAKNLWQARVDQNWRFYFTIEGDIFHMIDIKPHPK
ncbi:MAG: hypothetical protein A3H28_14200 [Acidobacteria bacterium RIFCSPLOWO2_02_FULL_61_28]|nr:MAG: hypothetical protein A3H28_14200 [Acidobacteria bacterium RIFCSPLOWO2_02_FULL_61_28]